MSDGNVFDDWNGPNSSPPPISTEPSQLKILDVGSMVAGPFLATVLGDLGAEVIKVEPPGHGEFARALGDDVGYSLLWQIHGRNKRSVTLNLTDPRGQAIFRQLVSWADILVENLRPGVMARWGLDYESVTELNPRLVYVSVSAFGQTGPYSGRAGYEWVGSAFSGLTHLTGYPDRPPVLSGFPITDHISALFATVGALEAIRRRDAAGAEGRGDHVDVALHDGAIRISNTFFTDYALNGVVQRREGATPSNLGGAYSRIGYTYETSDGRYIAVVAATRAQFERLVTAIGHPELTTDERFATERGRREHVVELDAVVRAWILARTCDEAFRLLLDADQAVSPVNGQAEVLADPHVQFRQNLITLENARGQRLPIPNVVPRLSDDPGSVRWAAQELGASNATIYQGLLGMTEDEVTALAEEGVI